MTRIYIFVLSIVAVLALLLDSIGSSTTFLTYLGIPSVVLMVVVLLLVGSLRFQSSNHFSSHSYWFASPLFLLILTGIIVGLSWWDFVTPDNYVFSKTLLRQEQLGVVWVYLVGLYVLTRSNAWWQRYYHLFMFCLPFLILFTLGVVRLWPMNYFLELVKEDHLIEWLQVWVLLVGAGILVSLIRKSFDKKLPVVAGLLIIYATSFVFLAGDEMSWGQRLIGLETPEAIRTANRQEELTIHNLYSVEWVVGWAYLLIGFGGAFLWLIPLVKKLPEVVYLFIPRWYLFGFFIFSGLYSSYSVFVGHNPMGAWSEVVELLMYMGIVIHVVDAFARYLSSMTPQNRLTK